jgi:hypothetical protein
MERELGEFIKELQVDLGRCVNARSRLPVRDHAFLDKLIETYEALIIRTQNLIHRCRQS